MREIKFKGACVIRDGLLVGRIMHQTAWYINANGGYTVEELRFVADHIDMINSGEISPPYVIDK